MCECGRYGAPLGSLLGGLGPTFYSVDPYAEYQRRLAAQRNYDPFEYQRGVATPKADALYEASRQSWLYWAQSQAALEPVRPRTRLDRYHSGWDTSRIR